MDEKLLEESSDPKNEGTEGFLTDINAPDNQLGAVHDEDSYASSSQNRLHFRTASEAKISSSANIFNHKKDLLAIILLAHTSMWLFADQNLIAPNLTEIANDFGMDERQRDEQLGGEVSFAFFFVGGIVSLAVGPLADTSNRINLFTIVVWLGAFPCLLTLFVTKFWQFLLLRTLTGVSLGGALPIIYSLAGDFFPPTQRNVIAGIITLILNLGSGIGQIIAGDVGAVWGWRVPFVIVAIPALISATLVKFLIQEPKRGRFRHAGDKPHDHKLSWTKFARVAEIRTNWLIFTQGIFGCIPWSVIVTYFSDYLHVDEGLGIGAVTSVFGVFSVGLGASILGGGVVGQILYNRRKGLEAILCTCTTLAGMVVFMYFINQDFHDGLHVWDYIVIFFGGVAGATGPNIRAMIMNVNPVDNQGTMFSVYTIADDLGKGLGPVFVALLILRLGRKEAFNIAFSCWLLCAVIILFTFWTSPLDELKLEEGNGLDESRSNHEPSDKKKKEHSKGDCSDHRYSENPFKKGTRGESIGSSIEAGEHKTSVDQPTRTEVV